MGAGTRLARDIGSWLDYLEATRRASPHTLAAYRRDLALLASVLAERGIDDTALIDAHAIRHAVSALHRRGLGGRSLQRFLSACRGFFNHFVSLGQLGANPALGVSAPKSPRKLPTTLDVDQAALLRSVKGARDVESLLAESMLNHFEACRALWAFRVIGLIRRVEAATPLDDDGLEFVIPEPEA